MPRRLPALILLAAAVALAFPAAAFAADAHVAVDGSDVTGTGAIDSPFASVQKAVDTASATGGGNVYVGPGTFTGGVTLRNGVSLYGAGASETTLTVTSGTVVTIDGIGAGETVSGFTITGGTASSGAGIYCANSSPVIERNVITGNTVHSLEIGMLHRGGGIYCVNGAPVIANNLVIGNTASGYYPLGAGIATVGSSAVIRGNTVVDNVVMSDVSQAKAGGILCSGGACVVTGNIIANNEVHSRGSMGAGISLESGAHQVSGNTITGNLAACDDNRSVGAGIHMDRTSGTVTRNVVTDNVARGISAEGGGIWFDAVWDPYAPTISANIIGGNIAEATHYTAAGGGISTSEGSPRLIGNLVTGNIARGASAEGGGIRCETFWDDYVSAPLVANNVVTANRAEASSSARGGAMYFDSSAAVVRNNTIVDNHLEAESLGAGGIQAHDFWGLGFPSISNCILWGNTGAEVAGVGVTYSCVEGGAGGTGNTAMNPLFAALPLDDYRLMPGSPCIDTADPATTYPTDIVGTPRPQGVGPDMGAYEFIPLVVPTPPVAVDDSYTVDEDTPLAVYGQGVLANDTAPVDAQPLTASVLIAPLHGTLTLDPSGSFTYEPAAEWSGTDTFQYAAANADGLPGVATVTITVEPVPDAPVVGTIADTSVDEGSLLAFTATATDADLPAQTLTFSLGAGAPAGATIDPDTGAFSWTPTEAQGPGSYDITVRASDGGLTGSQTFTVTVAEVATAPVLDPIADVSVDESTEVTFTASATDSDIPTETLTFALGAGAPAGAVIDAGSGVFSWTPSEAQGPGTFDIEVLVSDGALTDSQTFTVTVAEVATAPVLDPIADVSVDESTEVTFTASATDSDIPTETLTFSLGAGAPAGATIDPDTGAFSWTPTEAQGPGTFDIEVLVSDGALTDSQTFTVTVAEVATAPVLEPIPDVTIDELAQFALTVSATDADLPAQTLTFSLGAGAPAGATIDAGSGVFSWTPSEAQGPGTFDIEVLVSDGGLTDSQTFTITVAEVADPVPPAAGGSSSGNGAAPADGDEPDAVVTPAPDAADDPQADDPEQDAAQDEPAADEAPADAPGETADDEPGLPWWPFALVAGLAVLGVAVGVARRRRSAGGAV